MNNHGKGYGAWHWEEIAKRSVGMSFSGIATQLKCSPSVVQYYLEPTSLPCFPDPFDKRRRVDSMGQAVQYRARPMRIRNRRGVVLHIDSVGKGRPVIARRDAPERHRNIYCPQYGLCLEAVQKLNWPNFSCAECPLRGTREIPHGEVWKRVVET